MATVNTRPYFRPRKGRSGFDLLHASDTPEDAQRLAQEGYQPADPETARAAVTYNSKGWAQGEDAYRLGLKDRPVEAESWGNGMGITRSGPDLDWSDGKRNGATAATGRELDAAGMLGTGPDVEVTIGKPPMLWRKEQPKAEDWGDGKRGGMTGATGRELDAAGMLGTGPDVEVTEGKPRLLSRTPAMEQDWGDAKRSGMSNPPERPRAPGITVSAASKSPDDATYLQRLTSNSEPLKGREAGGHGLERFPFSDEQLEAMFPEPGKGTGGGGYNYAAESYDPILEAAQGQAREGRLIAAIGRAGAQFNESLTGAKYDRAAYDGYAKDAERPVGDLLQRRQAVSQRQARTRQAQQDRMRAEEHVANLRRQRSQDARQAENDAYHRQRDVVGDQRYAAKEAESARRFDLTRRDAAANRALQRQTQADTRALAQQQRVDAARAKAEAQAQENALKRGEKLGQATTKAPYGELQQALEGLDELAPGLIYGDETAQTPLSTKDRVVNALPFGAGDRLMSDKALQYKSNLQNLRDLITRARSGAAINASEEAHYLRLLGDDVLSDPRRAAAGINAVRQGIAQKLRDAQLAYSGPVLDQYEQGGGTTYRNPVFSGQAPQRRAASAPVVMLSPDGRQYTVDPSEVDEAQRNGWRLK